MEGKGGIFEGKTLDDAVRKGLDALRLSRAEVMIQVMEEGSSGFLGLGARPYKVRMMPRPRRELIERGERGGAREHGDRGGRRGERRGRGDREGRGERSGRGERDDRGGRGERGGRGGRGEVRADRDAGRGRPSREAGGNREVRGEREGRGDREGRERRESREVEQPRRPEEAPAMEARRDDEPRGPRRRRRRGRGGDDRPREDAPQESRAPRVAAAGGVATETAAPDFEREISNNGPDMPAEELAATAQRLAEDFFRAMGFEARVSSRAEADSVEVRAEIPQDSHLITGEKGEVRQSIQHLLNRMLNRGGTSRYHLQLEINDFWAQREKELQDLARQLADEAVADGAEKLTEYLNAQERRVVHVALREDARVRTYGLGDGLIKKVAIAPAGPDGEKRED